MRQVFRRPHSSYSPALAAGVWTLFVASLLLVVWVVQLATVTPAATEFWYSTRAGAALVCATALTFFALLVVASLVPLRTVLSPSTFATAFVALAVSAGMAQVLAISTARNVIAVEQKANKLHADVVGQFKKQISENEKQLDSLSKQLTTVENDLQTAGENQRQELQSKKDELTKLKNQLEDQNSKLAGMQQEIESHRADFVASVTNSQSSGSDTDGSPDGQGEAGNSTGEGNPNGGSVDGDKDGSQGGGNGGSQGSGDDGGAQDGSGDDGGESPTNDGGGEFLAAAAALIAAGFGVLMAFLPGILGVISLGTSIADLPAAFQAATAIVQQGENATVDSVLTPILQKSLKTPGPLLETFKGILNLPGIGTALKGEVKTALEAQLDLLPKLMSPALGIPLPTGQERMDLLKGLGDLNQLNPSQLSQKLIRILPAANRETVFDAAELVIQHAVKGTLTIGVVDGVLKDVGPLDATKGKALIDEIRKVREKATEKQEKREA